MPKNSPKPLEAAQKVMILHTVGVQVGLPIRTVYQTWTAGGLQLWATLKPLWANYLAVLGGRITTNIMLRYVSDI